jgi:outer membrane protein
MKSISRSLVRQCIVATALGMATMGAFAQEFRIGFVNTDRILREAAQAKAAQSKLEQEFSRREKDLQAQTKELKAASDKFERESPTMADAARLSRQRQLVDQDRDLQRKQREFQEDLTLRKNEELQLVLNAPTE